MTALPRPDARRVDLSPAVLVVTSCPWTGRAIDNALGDSGFLALRAADVDGAARLCTAGAIDALILDERTASFATPAGRQQTAALVRSAQARSTVPVVLLTHEPATAAVWADALDDGIWSVVSLPFGARWWVRQLDVWVRSAHETRRRLERGLVDLPTGLYNTRGLLRRAAEIEGDARRRGVSLACAVFSLSGPDGDVARMVDAISDVVRQHGRAGDVVGRTGDAEFALVATGADDEGMRAAVRRIARRVEDAIGAAPVMRVGAACAGESDVTHASVVDMLTLAARQRADASPA